MNVLSKVLAAAVVFFTAMSGVTFAGTPANTFSSQEECEQVVIEAYRGGYLPRVEYRPLFTALRAKMDTSLPVRQLGQHACLRMLVAGGETRWAYQSPTRQVRISTDGRPRFLEECGNPISGVRYIPFAASQALQYEESVTEQTPVERRETQYEEPAPQAQVVVHKHQFAMPPAGASFAGYSGMELTRDLGHDVVWGVVTDRVTGKLVQGWMHRESQRTQRARYDAQRGPNSVINIVAVQGNCNAVFGSSAHCVEQAPPREVIREVPVDRPIYIPVDRPVLVPIAQPPVRTEPGVSPPVFGQPPVRTEPGVGGPIFGDGGGQPTPPPYQPPTPGEPGN